jgi:hypothetical protein
VVGVLLVDVRHKGTKETKNSIFSFNKKNIYSCLEVKVKMPVLLRVERSSPFFTINLIPQPNQLLGPYP